MSNEGEADLLQEGLMTRLDDKLDELERAGRLSRPQLQEQFVGGGFEDGSVPKLAPGCGIRQKLSAAVKDLTCQWSEGFLALAYEGDMASCFIVAQMSFRPGGYGSIPFNRMAGLSWLFRAVDYGDLGARALARQVANDELMQHLAKKEIGDSAAADPDQLAEAVARWRIKDAEIMVEERRIIAEREKELGGE